MNCSPARCWPVRPRRCGRPSGRPACQVPASSTELFAAFGRRIEQSLARILAKPGWTRAAVITHEPALRYVLAHCQGLGLADLDAFAAKTGSVIVLDYPPGVVTLDAAIVRLVDGTGSDALRLG